MAHTPEAAHTGCGSTTHIHTASALLVVTVTAVRSWWTVHLQSSEAPQNLAVTVTATTGWWAIHLRGWQSARRKPCRGASWRGRQDRKPFGCSSMLNGPESIHFCCGRGNDVRSASALLAVTLVDNAWMPCWESWRRAGVTAGGKREGAQNTRGKAPCITNDAAR